ncbi:protein spindle-F [Anopheles nili]|uniref:protein spindle-F n=1 Tax=Anopheles nili TaxID=185578 RepID=UPI00237B3C0D|nr:protein spindle-F [Anopheles nili]
MSIAEPKDSPYCIPGASHHALQAALQTLKERCQTFQKRIASLEEENGTLRALQTKPPTVANDQYPERRNSNPTELERLQAIVFELTHQKMQMAEHISMVTSENRQLWKRLSLIVKEITLSLPEANVGEVGISVGPSTTLVTVNQQQTPAAIQPGQNLIRSRTFTKHAPNPKLRERLPRDGSSDEELINLEDISLLNTCGFLESNSADEQQGLTSSQEELLHATLEANPDFSRCTEGLLDIQRELTRQQQTMKNVFNQLKLPKELCHRCKNRQPVPESKKLMKDVTVEVEESELLPVAEQQRQPSAECLIPQPAPRESTFPTATGIALRKEACQLDTMAVTDDSESVKNGMINLLQEKLRANGIEKVCPMCGKLYGQETIFDEFQGHVESHFLVENELDELSLDRAYEYISQTVGNF